MTFWDASALVPLLIAETSTPSLQELAAVDPVMVVWWASEVECASAIARLEPDGKTEAFRAGLERDELLMALLGHAPVRDLLGAPRLLLAQRLLGEGSSLGAVKVFRMRRP